MPIIPYRDRKSTSLNSSPILPSPPLFRSDGGAHHHRGEDPGVAALRDLRAEQRREDRDRHADHPVQVAAPRALGTRQAAEAQDEKDRRADVRDGGERD